MTCSDNKETLTAAPTAHSVQKQAVRVHHWASREASLRHCSGLGTEAFPLTSVICAAVVLQVRKNPEKNLTQETCPDRGSNPGPLRDKRACYHLLHSGGHNNNNNNNNNNMLINFLSKYNYYISIVWGTLELSFVEFWNCHINCQNFMILILYILDWGRRVIGISGSLIWSKTLTELIFNPCGDFWWNPEGPVSQMHSPHLLVGAPGIFSDLLGFVQMLKIEWGAESKGSYCTYSSLVKRQPRFLSLKWKTCLWGRIAALVPEFAVNDVPLGRTLMMKGEVKLRWWMNLQLKVVEWNVNESDGNE